MADLLQWATQTYETREQLVADGVWGGELYYVPGSGAQVVRPLGAHARGWIWRTLLLPSGGDEFDEGVRIPELVSVPIVSAKTREHEHERPQSEHHKHQKLLSHSPLWTVTNGIRKLTPRETTRHPLHDEPRSGAGLSDREGMDLEETLDILDLDLSRLMIDDIFRTPQVHAQMRQILFNYLVQSPPRDSAHHRADSIDSPLSERRFYYKQGFHEILGLVYLQMYETEGGIQERSMQNILFMYTKLMDQLAPAFYREDSLIKWESGTLSKMLQMCSPNLFKIFYHEQAHQNTIWLIRWTRLLFLRELPRETVLVIWDHIFTFSYPLKTFVASLVVSVILPLYKTFIVGMEPDELVEIMLHIGENPLVRDRDPVQLCKLAGDMCQLWHVGNFSGLKSLVDRYLESLDPNRRRLEEKLRVRVKRNIRT
ncbi:GTPase-activating protein GYP6 KNAG_0H02270 [Huiozyma naganishii CBS 8797]|uniref:Rab-GAP TBC domain-containing protein n=1 Tax=Huiozyma naganishii (strain ATCC MYA-139 / BCRC 22969 / CBS 8797 / KCTC 17520 / NBRC 10181 / NCYC 3082 / Yp74L-3) TaxID=1071383 RepID=J7S9Q4_HUIN7|nr:hypothetical protein KNAG_0H02270 [Kazachstania naganishii CBS 8797]CCK71641.1 hypothetical protein KNAG_0H02270 [Kazachstania naganishii CBS 8797]